MVRLLRCNATLYHINLILYHINRTLHLRCNSHVYPPILHSSRAICFDDSLDGIHAPTSTSTSDDANRSTPSSCLGASTDDAGSSYLTGTPYAMAIPPPPSAYAPQHHQPPVTTPTPPTAPTTLETSCPPRCVGPATFDHLSNPLTITSSSTANSSHSQLRSCHGDRHFYGSIIRFSNHSSQPASTTAFEILGAWLPTSTRLLIERMPMTNMAQTTIARFCTTFTISVINSPTPATRPCSTMSPSSSRAQGSKQMTSPRCRNGLLPNERMTSTGMPTTSTSPFSSPDSKPRTALNVYPPVADTVGCVCVCQYLCPRSSSIAPVE